LLGPKSFMTGRLTTTALTQWPRPMVFPSLPSMSSLRLYRCNSLVSSTGLHPTSLLSLHALRLLHFDPCTSFRAFHFASAHPLHILHIMLSLETPWLLTGRYDGPFAVAMISRLRVALRYTTSPSLMSEGFSQGYLPFIFRISNHHVLRHE
jgi:hypothetical protein